VKKIISYTKKVRYDRTRREEMLTFFRAGVLVPEDAYFHWFKIVEILRLKPWRVLKKPNDIWVCPIAGVDGEFLGDLPQLSRHIKDSKRVKKTKLAKWRGMNYKDHLKPVMQYFIENY